MADKSTQFMIDALSRAATDPNGIALFGSKSEPGLFPATTSARLAAQRCRDEGYLQVVRSESRGKKTVEVCVLTEKGLAYLTRQACPRQVVEDFLRTLELRESQVERMLRATQQMADSLRSMRTAVVEILPQLKERDAVLRNGVHHPELNSKPTPVPPEHVPLWTMVLARLSEWHAAAGASEDCPLSELYRRIGQESGSPTIGEFHDCLRFLHDEHQLYLHPWTGPLYELPEPAFALLIGHEIAYYASRR